MSTKTRSFQFSFSAWTTMSRNVSTRSVRSAAAAASYSGSEESAKRLLLARVEEDLGPVGQVGEGPRGLDVLGEERVGLPAVRLHRHVFGPRVAEL